jgi:DNA modification methylase
MIKINSIKKNPKNPRILKDDKFEKLKASIESFPRMMELRPIVIDSDGIILGGNMRFQAIKSLGMKEIPDAWVKRAEDLTDEQKREFVIKDNAGFGEWDWDTLANEWDHLPLVEWGLEVPTIELVDDKEILEDEVPEVPKEPIIKPGDLWILGEHRLLCGDSTKTEDVARLMDGAKADMVLTDPPYGVSYVGKTKETLRVENDDLGEEDLTSLVVAAFDNAESNCRAGAYWYATVPAGPLEILFADDWKRRGILRQIMVWAKDKLVPGRSEYQYQHEPILFGWIPGKRHKNSDRTRTTLWQYSRPTANREHPTMKPVALWRKAVTDGSRQGEVVYDPFLGSGTTLIAAEQLGRKCYGMEISPAYCDVIVKRWETLTGKKAVLETK